MNPGGCWDLGPSEAILLGFQICAWQLVGAKAVLNSISRLGGVQSLDAPMYAVFL